MRVKCLSQEHKVPGPGSTQTSSSRVACIKLEATTSPFIKIYYFILYRLPANYHAFGGRHIHMLIHQFATLS